MADVLVVGCGLIGTSIGLALRGERSVLLHDSDASVVAEAVSRGAGAAWDGREPASLVVVAVPPTAVAPALRRLQDLHLAQTYTHVASVQSQVQREIEILDCDLSSVVGGHPLAGRESSGPGAATADLFVGRPWAICAGPQSSAAAIAEVRELALACGAQPVEVDGEVHDRSVALFSHLPQVAASALAGLLDAQQHAGHAVTTVLSGPGLVDTTRLAASDARLWSDILGLNAEHVAPLARALAAHLDGLATALEGASLDAPLARAHLQSFLEQGNRGRALVPVKRGELSEAFARVRVSVDDRPGRLAALLTSAGDAGYNVEDVHVEHVPGRPTGVIELLVDVAAVQGLTTALEALDWHVLGS